MAETAYQTQYLAEFIAGFEQRQSLLRGTVTTEAEIKGSSAVFLVADSGDAEAVTRGVNGLIPARADNLEQNTCTLAEWHDLVRRTRYNLYASQGDGRRIMQENTMAVMNRKIDQDIITALGTGTQNTGAAAAASMRLVTRSKTILGNNHVRGGGINGAITPAFHGYLMELKEFSSADYSVRRPLDDEDIEDAFKWFGVNWIVHTKLPGAGTNAEKCFLYHRNAVGHACDTENVATAADYNSEQDYSFARASAFMGSKVLQNSGILVINHDGSALSS